MEYSKDELMTYLTLLSNRDFHYASNALMAVTPPTPTNDRESIISNDMAQYDNTLDDIELIHAHAYTLRSQIMDYDTAKSAEDMDRAYVGIKGSLEDYPASFTMDSVEELANRVPNFDLTYFPLIKMVESNALLTESLNDLDRFHGLSF